MQWQGFNIVRQWAEARKLKRSIETLGVLQPGDPGYEQLQEDRENLNSLRWKIRLKLAIVLSVLTGGAAFELYRAMDSEDESLNQPFLDAISSVSASVKPQPNPWTETLPKEVLPMNLQVFLRDSLFLDDFTPLAQNILDDPVNGPLLKLDLAWRTIFDEWRKKIKDSALADILLTYRNSSIPRFRGIPANAAQAMRTTCKSYSVDMRHPPEPCRGGRTWFFVDTLYSGPDGDPRHQWFQKFLIPYWNVDEMTLYIPFINSFQIFYGHSLAYPEFFFALTDVYFDIWERAFFYHKHRSQSENYGLVFKSMLPMPFPNKPGYHDAKQKFLDSFPRSSSKDTVFSFLKSFFRSMLIDRMRFNYNTIDRKNDSDKENVRRDKFKGNIVQGAIAGTATVVYNYIRFLYDDPDPALKPYQPYLEEILKNPHLYLDF